ncbi:alginate lyase-domain-containing protein [Mycena galopus ATCC 62051]|nr:alginate lyase-domain-containing protein [Mycena galopus ATCC 62051]
MNHRRRATDEPSFPGDAVAIPAPQAPLGSALPSVPVSSLTQSTTTSTEVAGTTPPPQAAVKTKSSSGKSVKATSQTSSCTPSPTKAMPPSATWTTCPYKVQDGHVNPDVRILNDSGYINAVAQSILYNAVAYAQTKFSAHCKNVASFIDTFFVNPSTRMNPHMKFGQVVRGPGPNGEQGTFTGIVDLRWIVKVANALLILRTVKDCQDWTPNMDQAINDWMTAYVHWLTTSDLGLSAGSKANNHCSFYVAQVAAARMAKGDEAGASQMLQEYFAGPFRDQIARGGEQPFEAVRTRPYHYRTFNLEAMIASTNAKLGDQLGMNFWTAESKQNATIQTALDYAMGLDPGKEDGTEILPHVAAVAAAYGDTTGKYTAFLEKNDGSYQTQAYWYYDQPTSRAQNDRRDAGVENTVVDNVEWTCICDLPDSAGACEMVNGEPAVVLDNGVTATCAELWPFYSVQ